MLKMCWAGRCRTELGTELPTAAHTLQVGRWVHECRGWCWVGGMVG
jgi:hypothetical protein